MRPNLDVEAVLQRRDDAPARSVILGIRARDEDHVNRQANLVALDLDVLLFHQIEQADLHLLGGDRAAQLIAKMPRLVRGISP